MERTFKDVIKDNRKEILILGGTLNEELYHYRKRQYI